MPSQRIGFFGGTFDPVHSAHLQIARAAFEQCALAEVLFVPAGTPPHRQTVAPFEDRFRMVEIACASLAGFIPSRLEANDEKTYSIRSVERLRSELPEADIFFLIGADAFADLKTWFRWNDLAALVTFAVIHRPGFSYEIPAGVRVHEIFGVDLPVSASEIRAKLAAGRTDVDLPSGVLSYIHRHQLYSPK